MISGVHDFFFSAVSLAISERDSEGEEMIERERENLNFVHLIPLVLPQLHGQPQWVTEPAWQTAGDLGSIEPPTNDIIC